MTNESKIRKIAKLLRKAYGVPKPRKTPPVDELVRTILSQNTSDRNSVPAFWALKKRFGSWERVLEAPTVSIAVTIKHAGLANIKSARIIGVLRQIKETNGKISLARLKDMSAEDGLSYLKSLKGVGPKTAACVLLFSFGKPVMPVDTHIFRVTKRIGLIPKDVTIEGAHDILTGLVPKDLIYEFHLGIISHGRETCRAPGPKCGSCLLYGMCGFKMKSLYRKKELCR
ncbi:MAG: endonuclease III [Candidatus Omnitrophica bacterium]|nr:endonuclease III [Candidatus Omnitrophota bacterium]